MDLSAKIKILSLCHERQTEQRNSFFFRLNATKYHVFHSLEITHPSKTINKRYALFLINLRKQHSFKAHLTLNNANMSRNDVQYSSWLDVIPNSCLIVLFFLENSKYLSQPILWLP